MWIGWLEVIVAAGLSVIVGWLVMYMARVPDR